MLFNKLALALLSIVAVVVALPISPSVNVAPDTKAVKRDPGVGVDGDFERLKFNRRLCGSSESSNSGSDGNQNFSYC